MRGRVRGRAGMLAVAVRAFTYGIEKMNNNDGIGCGDVSATYWRLNSQFSPAPTRDSLTRGRFRRAH